MKQFIRDYFTFNKRERNGIFVLLSVIGLLIVYHRISDCLLQEEQIDFTAFEKEIRWLKNEQPEKRSVLPTANRELPTRSFQRFLFDPNNLPESEWKKLGLTEKQIRSIKKYESKGGTFRCKGDVKKMVVISSRLYASLEPYISIPENEPHQTSRSATQKENTKITLLELNSADSSQLTTLKGIGPYFAKNIIKYRNALGGYCTKEQLMEVWKFDKEKYATIENQVTVDYSRILQININTCMAAELKHPYISWNIANAIVHYRMKHGNFATVEEIKRCGIIDEKTFLRMAPYLNVGN
jgi:competence protein ComEA